jgi:NAD+ kinase
MGMVEMEVLIDKYPIQFIRGSGAIVSTATGSTGYNLSAHGPIVSPDIQCLIVTELLDHNTPTPSIVVKPTHKVDLKIKDFRARNILAISGKKEKFDVLLSVDGNAIFPLKKDDVVRVSGSALPVVFAELEKDYFFKSLQEKFSFE